MKHNPKANCGESLRLSLPWGPRRLLTKLPQPLGLMAWGPTFVGWCCVAKLGKFAWGGVQLAVSAAGVFTSPWPPLLIATSAHEQMKLSAACMVMTRTWDAPTNSLRPVLLINTIQDRNGSLGVGSGEPVCVYIATVHVHEKRSGLALTGGDSPEAGNLRPSLGRARAFSGSFYQRGLMAIRSLNSKLLILTGIASACLQVA